MVKELKKGDLVICETTSSVYSYHLRVIGDEGPKFSGGAPNALCGRTMGWDTQIPISAYGIRDHLPSHWCEQCLEAAKKLVRHDIGQLKRMITTHGIK